MKIEDFCGTYIVSLKILPRQTYVFFSPRPPGLMKRGVLALSLMVNLRRALVYIVYLHVYIYIYIEYIHMHMNMYTTTLPSCSR